MPNYTDTLASILQTFEFDSAYARIIDAAAQNA
jgi:hypothetical protein